MQSGLAARSGLSGWSVRVVTLTQRPRRRRIAGHTRLQTLDAIGEPGRVCRAAPPPREPRSQRHYLKAAPHAVKRHRRAGPRTQRARSTHTRRHPYQCSGVHPARRTPAPSRPSARARAAPNPRRRCSHRRRERLGHCRRRAPPPPQSRAQVCSRRAPREG